MKKILTIGNSFSTDAMRYFYGIARACGKDIKAVNLYIGGCSLYRHYRNMLSEENAYEYQIDGISTGIFVSLKQALLSDEWDVVVLQQSSPKSGEYDTYQPFLSALSEYVKKLAPKAKQYIHETWSFAEGAPRFKLTPFAGRDDMIPRVRDAYHRAAEDIAADGLIPSLEAMCRLYDEIGERTYRDGFHSNLGITRYMLGCLWCIAILEIDVRDNSFRDFDIEVTDTDCALAERIATEASAM